MTLLSPAIYARCDECQTEHKLFDTHPMQIIPSTTYLHQSLRDEGWSVGKHGRSVCPTCRGKAKRAR